jgi:hypothetical protein
LQAPVGIIRRASRGIPAIIDLRSQQVRSVVAVLRRSGDAGIGYAGQVAAGLPKLARWWFIIKVPDRIIHSCL